jgi:TRAP-type uncharacterized transport system substrate-binding protein
VVASLKRPRVLYVIGGAAIVLTLLLIGWLFDPPQRHVRLAAGPEGSIEFHFARRYSEILASEGVQLEVVATRGVHQNLALIQDPKSGIDVALIEGGTTSARQSPDLVSLGTLYYRPVWVFYRGTLPAPGAPWPPTLRIALGPEGNDSSSLSRQLLLESGAGVDAANFRYLERPDAADSLIAGTVDAVAMVAPWDSPWVQRLLRADSIHLMPFERAAARVALHPALTKLVLPEGVVDLAKNIPDHDVPLVAAKMSMAAHRDLHPALQYLLLDALAEVHGGGGMFEHAGEFPAAEAGDLPLSKAASSHHKSGTPFLQRHLPFWVAAIITQIVLLLIPIIGILYPVLQGAPTLYEALMQHRVSRVYGHLKLLEIDIAEGKVTDKEAALKELDALDMRARRLPTSATYVSMTYTLRGHIQLVRDRLLRS